MTSEVTKLDIAFEHVQTAVLLSALGWSARSLHLQVMAADELLASVARAGLITLAMDIDAFISPDQEQFWRRAKRKAYNYFKHADRDAEEAYAGPGDDDLQAFNELMLMQAVTNLSALGRSSNALKCFSQGMMLLYPQAFDWVRYRADHPEMWESAQLLLGNIGRRDINSAIIAQWVAEGRLSASELSTAIDFSGRLR